MEKNLKKDFSEILEYAHMWNWAPDLFIVEKIYDEVPNSFSVLTPFLYVYLEELVRSMTKNQYGVRLDDENSKKAKGLQIQTIRLRLFKIEGKLILTGRRMMLKLSTHHVYKDEFFHILRQIQSLFW